MTAIPVLMYHEIVEGGVPSALSRRVQGSHFVDRRDFEGQIAFLKRAGYRTIDLSQLVAGTGHRNSLSEKDIVITFDDGFEGNHAHAFPVLKRSGMSATIFVATGQVGRETMLNWDQILEMRKDGMSIQSHTVTHPLLSTLSEEGKVHELGASKSELEARLGAPVDFLSYPNGDYDATVIGLLERLGYRGACTSEFGTNGPGADAYRLKRIKIPAGFSLKQFEDVLNPHSALYAFAYARNRTLAMAKRAIGRSNYEKLYMKFFKLTS